MVFFLAWTELVYSASAWPPVSQLLPPSGPTCAPQMLLWGYLAQRWLAMWPICWVSAQHSEYKGATLGSGELKFKASLWNHVAPTFWAESQRGLRVGVVAWTPSSALPSSLKRLLLSGRRLTYFTLDSLPSLSVSFSPCPGWWKYQALLSLSSSILH